MQPLELLNRASFQQDMVLPIKIVRDEVKEERKLVNGIVITNRNLLINQD
jgi:hypothetical protein